MQSSKPIRHSDFSQSAGPKISWNSAAQGVALVSAFLFVAALVCGVL